MKRCSRCHKKQSLNLFGNLKKTKDGKRYECNNCRKEYYIKNSDIIKKKIKLNYIKNSEKIKKYQKEYNSKNKDKIRKRKYIYNKKKLLEDPLYKFKENIRCLIKNSLKLKGYKKDTKTTEILGTDFETVIYHLNNNIYGFIYGDKELDIDHIVPLSCAKNKEEMIKLCHYSNLQLLPSYYNRIIKSNNTFNKQDFIIYLNNKVSQTRKKL